MKDLIQLQHCHATKEHKDDVWHVRENITNEELYDLPKEFTESQVFTILDFAKKYELIALNSGITFQKKFDNEKFTKIEKGLLKVIDELKIANEKLADKLTKFI